MSECNECHKSFPENLPLITGASTAKLGLVYEGPEICDDCLDKYYEAARTKVHCPHCQDEGWYIGEGVEPGCCGHPAGSGECCGNPIPVPVPIQEQCRFCHETSNSAFNVTAKAIVASKEEGG